MTTKGSIDVLARLLGGQDMLTQLKQIQAVGQQIESKQVTLTVKTQGVDVATRQQEQLAIRIEDMKGKIAALQVKMTEYTKETKESSKALDANRLATYTAQLKNMEQQYGRNAQAIALATQEHAKEQAAAQAAAEAHARAQATLGAQIQRTIGTFSQYAPALKATSQGIDKFLSFVVSIPKSLAGAADQLVHFGQVMASFAYRATLVTAPLIAALTASTRTAIDFEHTMGMVATQLDLTGDELKQFTADTTRYITDLSTRISRDVNDLAQAMYYLVSSLTIAPQEARAMLEPIAKAAVAGAATAEMVAESITPILNVYDLITGDIEETARNVEHVLDVIFSAVKKGRAEFADMAVQIGDFVQFAKLAGASLEEAMAVFAQATRVTTPAQAATWTANIYRTLFTPASVEAIHNVGIAVEEVVGGTGQWVEQTILLSDAQRKQYLQAYNALHGKEGLTGLYGTLANQQAQLAEAHEDYALRESVDGRQRIERLQREIGITQERIKVHETTMAVLNKQSEITEKVWSGEMKRKSSLQLITEIAAKLKEQRSEQEKLNILYEVFPTLRGLAGAVVFVQNLAEVTEWQKEWAAATGITQEAYEIMAETVKEVLRLLGQQFQAFGIEVFYAYKDNIKAFIRGFGELLKTFRDMDPALKKQIVAWLAMTAALGPLSLIVSTVLMGLGGLVTVAAQLLSPLGIAGLVLAWQAFGDTLSAAWGTIQDYTSAMGLKGLVALVADLAVAFGLLQRSDADRILQAMGISTQAIDSANFNTFVQSVRDFGQSLSDFWEKIVGFFQGFLQFIDETAKRQNTFGKTVGALTDFVTWLGKLLGITGFDATKVGIEGVANSIDILADKLLKLYLLSKGASVLAGILTLGRKLVGAPAAAGGAGAGVAVATKLAELIAQAGPAAMEPHALALLVAKAMQPEYPSSEDVRWIMEHFGVSGPAAARWAYQWSQLPTAPAPGEAVWTTPWTMGPAPAPPAAPPAPPAISVETVRRQAMQAMADYWLKRTQDAASLSAKAAEDQEKAAEDQEKAATAQEDSATKLQEAIDAWTEIAEDLEETSPFTDLIKETLTLAQELLAQGDIAAASQLLATLDPLQASLEKTTAASDSLSTAARSAASGLGSLAAALIAVGQAIPGDWWTAFAAEHGGRTPLEQYRRHERPLQAATIDLLWSQDFARRMGRPPTQAEWQQHWYETWMPLEAYPGGPIAAAPSTVAFAPEANKLLQDLADEKFPGLSTSLASMEKAYNDGQTAQEGLITSLDNLRGTDDHLITSVDALTKAVDANTAAQRGGGGGGGGGEGGGTDGGGTDGGGRHGGYSERQFGGYAWADALYRLAEHGKPEFVISSPTLRALERQMGVVTQSKLRGLAGGTNITIGSISLPAVSDARSFVHELQRIARQANSMARLGYGN